MFPAPQKDSKIMREPEIYHSIWGAGNIPLYLGGAGNIPLYLGGSKYTTLFRGGVEIYNFVGK